MESFNEYSDDAMRTAGNGVFLKSYDFFVRHRDTIPAEVAAELQELFRQDEFNVGLMHDALGLAGEAGEVADYIKKVMGHGKPFDQDVVEKELGDVLWYINRMTRRLGTKLASIATKNIAKLMARYPAGFSHDASNNRKA